MRHMPAHYVGFWLIDWFLYTGQGDIACAVYRTREYCTCPGIDRDPGFNPGTRDPDPFYPDPDPSRFEFKIPDFSGFYENFKIFNLHSLHDIIYLSVGIHAVFFNKKLKFFPGCQFLNFLRFWAYQFHNQFLKFVTPVLRCYIVLA